MPAKLTPAQKQNYQNKVKLAGHANIVLGWLWVVSSIFWGLVLLGLSMAHGIFGVVGSFAISLSTPALLMTLGVNIGLSAMYLIMGAYIKSLAGKQVRTFLIICSVVSVLSCLAILPIIPALFSLYGLVVYRKLVQAKGRTFKRTDLLRQYQAQARVAGALLGIALIAGLAGVIKANQSINASATGSSKHDRYFNAGICISKSSTQCVYRNPAAGYQVTFPITLAPTPTVFDSALASGQPYSQFNGQAAYTDVSMNGYAVKAYIYKNPTTDTLSRLEQVRNQDDNDLCGTNPATDELTTYLSYPAIITSISGIDDYAKAPCHRFFTTFAKANYVYDIYGNEIDSKTNLEPVSAATYQAFLYSFKLTH